MDPDRMFLDRTHNYIEQLITEGKKIQLIRLIRLVSDLGLKEAKEIAEAKIARYTKLNAIRKAQSIILENMSPPDADFICTLLSTHVD